MTKEIVILGAGLVGHAIARDLQAHEPTYKVTVTDKNLTRLKELEDSYALSTQELDATDKEALRRVVSDYDLVIGALPGFLGFRTIEEVIKAQRPIVDISFFSENAFELDELARKHQVPVIVDAGVAPGLSNLIAGYEFQNLNEMREYYCYVGGLPKARILPFEYKAPFSPIDVLEEYTRVVTYKENGVIKTIEPLSLKENLVFPRIGTLEAFATDGLRTLLHTLPIPTMIEKTLRYPGHASLIKLFKDLGFLSSTPVELKSGKVIPLELTAHLFEKAWRFTEFEEDLTIMRIVIKGKDKEGKNVRKEYTLHDEYDAHHRVMSMARTTGYTAAIIARLVLQQRYTEIGVHPLEHLGKEVHLFHEIMEELSNRGVVFQIVVKTEDPLFHPRS